MSLESHCAGECGCYPNGELISHEEVEKKLDRALAPNILGSIEDGLSYTTDLILGKVSLKNYKGIIQEISKSIAFDLKRIYSPRNY